VDQIYPAPDGNQRGDILSGTSHEFGLVPYTHAMLLDKGFENNGPETKVKL
jgi:hypothetical protein